MSAAIYEAIPAILADVDAIGKNRNNQQQSYKFRGIDDVYNAIHPLLAKHKVFPTCEILSREMTERQTKTGGALFYVNLKAKYTLWAHDGSCVVTEAWGEAMDSGDKATNKAMSVAYKYALFQLLCIPTEAVDPDQESHDVAPKADAKATQKSKAKEVAAQHGMKTADQLPQTISADTAVKGLKSIDASQPNASERLTKAEDVIYQSFKAGTISQEDKGKLDFMVAEIQKEIDGHKQLDQEAAAAAA